MTKQNPNTFDIDNSSILYLSLIRKDHTNIFRFTLTMTEEIQPQLLQTAVDLVYHRFPSVFAGFPHNFFRYQQVQAPQPPKVAPDPGCLITMTPAEIARCACRVYYRENQIIVEGFHALTDGYGMAATFCTMAAEYLKLRYDIQIPTGYPIMDIQSSVLEEETEDSYLKYANAKPLHLPSRYSYQLPGKEASHDRIHETLMCFPVSDVLNAAHRYGVSMTALLSAVMARSIMKVQHRSAKARLRPVRIMVPIDLRRIFPSKTLRNFILYALPTMEVSESELSIQELAHKFSGQIKSHLKKDNLAGIIAYNVNTQKSLLYKLLPAKVKCSLMRLAYRFFGESNSSITFTNLGTVSVPEVMVPYIRSIHLTMTPRVRSPYNCGMISYNGKFYINLCRFPEKSELAEIFRRNLERILQNKDSAI